MKTIVICSGNTLRGDDGIGPRVAVELPRALQVIEAPQLQPELADAIREAERVIFVDATRDGTPGEIWCAPVEPCDTDSHLTHSLAPSTVLAYAAKLYDAHPAAMQVTVCGERFDLGEGLSPAVEAAVPRVVTLVKHMSRTTRWIVPLRARQNSPLSPRAGRGSG